MQEYQKKAFDFAADLTKQLITLATGIIALTVTFSKDIFGGANSRYMWLLVLTWIVYLISVFFGLATLSALTGNLDRIARAKKDKDGTTLKDADGETLREPQPDPILTITSDNVRGSSKMQIYSFLTAVALTVGYASLSAAFPYKPDQLTNCCNTVNGNTANTTR